MKLSIYSPRVLVFRNRSIILNSTLEVNEKTDQEIPCGSTSRPLQQARQSKLLWSEKCSSILLTNISRNQTDALHKNVNRGSVSVSYSFMGNMKSFINPHQGRI